jgi:hypothetical protein
MLVNQVDLSGKIEVDAPLEPIAIKQAKGY